MIFEIVTNFILFREPLEEKNCIENGALFENVFR